LEKLDTGDEVEDDVLAARDFAKELKEQDFDEDQTEALGVDMPNGEPDLLVEDPEATSQEGPALAIESLEAKEGLYDDIALGNHDFQTPPKNAEHLTYPTTNLKQYLTPAQIEEEIETANAISLEAAQANASLDATKDGPLLQERNELLGVPPAPQIVDDGLLRELKSLKAKLKSMETEKGEIVNEARKLRKHMVTLNEQLEAADNELEAQRRELLKAAESLESNRKHSASILSDTKSKHAASAKEMEQKHAAAKMN
jgi:hypothetical protein